jgi:hypothetical protein
VSARAKAKVKTPRTAKPSEMAFVAAAPCPDCGCEWAAPTVRFATDAGEALPEAEIGSTCANPWHETVVTLRAFIAKLKADRLLLARLAAETPQFNNPLIVYEAQALRDRLLAEVSS